MKIRRAKNKQTLVRTLLLTGLSIAIVTTAIVIGVSASKFYSQNNTAPSTSVNTPQNFKPETYQKNINKVTLGMKQSQVEAYIGKPQLCSQKTVQIQEGKTNVMQHCGYDLGEDNTFQQATYLNGNLWSLNSVQGSIQQLAY